MDNIHAFIYVPEFEKIIKKPIPEGVRKE